MRPKKKNKKPVPEAKAPESSQVMKRKKEDLIFESVFETACGEFRKNKPFVVRRDGFDLFVGLYMPFENIGGLSAKDKSDESKGSILNLINSGSISVLFNPQLRDEDAVIFIPNRDTVQRMQEFVLLNKADYTICFVDPQTGQLEKTDVHMDLNKIQKYADGGLSIGTDPAVSELLADARLDDEPEVITSPVVDVQESFIRDDDDDEDEPESSSVAAKPTETLSGEVPQAPPDEDFDDPDDEAYGGGDEDEDDSDFTPDDSDQVDDMQEDEIQEQVENQVEQDIIVNPELSVLAAQRRFFNDDLTRELTTAGLDQTLAPQLIFKPLEKRPGGWLDDQMNAMIDLANQELYALHQANIVTVRQKYLDTMAEAYESEMRIISDPSPDPRYAKMQSVRQEHLTKLPAEIDAERQRAAERFEQRVKEAGESARLRAENDYRERYRWTHEEELQAIETKMKAGMDVSYEKSLAELKEILKKEVQVKLDDLDTVQIHACVDLYAELSQKEAAMFEDHKARILAFLEENRQADIARVKALEEEHIRTNKVEVLEKEYAEKVNAMREEFDARVATLNQDIQAMQQRHADDLEVKDREMAKLSVKHKADSEVQQERIDRLLNDITSLDDKKAQEFAGQMNNLIAERDSYSQKYDMLVKFQRKGNRLAAALCAIAILAALAVGAWIGVAMHDRISPPVEVTAQITPGPSDGGA